MSSGLRAFVWLITASAVVTTYVALNLAVTAGLDLQARDRFREAPARAAAFVAALGRYADGDGSARAEVLAGNSWFEENGPVGLSRSMVSAAADSAVEGRFDAVGSLSRDLAVEIGQDQAELERESDSSGAVALWWSLAAGVFVVPSWWLRRRRRSGAADVIAVVSEFTIRRPWWRRPVFLAVNGIGYALFVAALLTVSAAQRNGYQIPLELQLLALLGGLAVLWASVVMLRYSRPRSVRSAAQTLRVDGRAPVLYLRSFADDRTAARVDDAVAYNIHSREEQLVAALNAFGPVIAVGKPGEPLPHLGAARLYLPSDDWRTTVLRLMELSQLIVLHLGKGEGLWWEVGQARTTQPAGKLVLLVPGQPADVAARLDEHLPTPSRLDEVAVADPWVSAVIAFDSDWTARVHPVKPEGPSRHGSRARRVASAVLTTLTSPSVRSAPAHRVVRAMKAALASVGVRKRMMVMRVSVGLLATLGKGVVIIAILVLAFRTLPLLGVRL